MRGVRVPDRADVDDDTPLSLHVAVALAFPDGSMTIKGLRRERDAGRLVTEVMAGKEYTTLGYIKQMRELCVRKREPQMSHNMVQAQQGAIPDAAVARAAALLSIDRLGEIIRQRREAKKDARHREVAEARAAWAARNAK